MEREVKEKQSYINWRDFKAKEKIEKAVLEEYKELTQVVKMKDSIVQKCKEI